MKRIFQSFSLFALSICIVGVIACKKEEEPTTDELIRDLWDATALSFNGNPSANFDVTFRFDACVSGTCEMIDYNGNDNTTGSCTYVVNAAGDKVTITDTDPDGGNWDGTWTITEITETKLKMNTTNNFNGDVSIEMSVR